MRADKTRTCRQLTFATGYGEAHIGSPSAIADVLTPLPVIRGEFPVSVFGDTQVGAWLVSSRVETYTKGLVVRNFNESVQNAEKAYKNIHCVDEMLDLDSVGDGLRIRGRRPGDRFQPLGMQGSKSMREFMIDARIPQRWRNGLPLVVSEKGIVCVPGWRIAHWARVTDKDKARSAITLTYNDERGRTQGWQTS